MIIVKNCVGKDPKKTVYDLFSDDLTRVFPIELTVDQAKTLAGRKGNSLITPMELYLKSDGKYNKGIYATEVKTVQELT